VSWSRSQSVVSVCEQHLRSSITPAGIFLSHDRSSVLFPLTGGELEAKAILVNNEVSEVVPYLVQISSYASGIDYNRILFVASCPRNMPSQKSGNFYSDM